MTSEPARDGPTERLAGHAVVDSHLKTVGTVMDVLFDEREAAPLWAVVRTGALRGEHYMPLADSYVDFAGRLVVPHAKASIKHAPRARRRHVVTRSFARKVHEYYSLAA
jgi:sporulation protein YlmC with PRC-barrel domain